MDTKRFDRNVKQTAARIAAGLFRALARFIAAAFGVPLGLAAAITLMCVLVILGVYGAMPAAVQADAAKPRYVEASRSTVRVIKSPDAAEEEHRVPWGLLYAVDFFSNATSGKYARYAGDESAKALSPVFRYRKSVVIREYVEEDEEGKPRRIRTEEPVDLLESASTFRGDYFYEYEWVTEGVNPRVRREVRRAATYRPDWTKLREYLATRVGGVVSDADVLMVFRAGEAFTAGKPHLDWLGTEEEVWVSETVGWNWESGIPPTEGVPAWPVRGEITSGFGERIHPMYGKPAVHNGVDIAAPIGTPVRAAKAGKVRFAGRAGGYGLTVVLDHGGNVFTVYGHNHVIHVAEGEMVTEGARIASVGSTGLSTGPHLHFEVRINGKPIDPVGWIGVTQ